MGTKCSIFIPPIFFVIKINEPQPMQQCRWILTTSSKKDSKDYTQHRAVYETKNSYKKICFLGIHMDAIKLDKGNAGE